MEQLLPELKSKIINTKTQRQLNTHIREESKYDFFTSECLSGITLKEVAKYTSMKAPFVFCIFERRNHIFSNILVNAKPEYDNTEILTGYTRMRIFDIDEEPDEDNYELVIARSFENEIIKSEYVEVLSNDTEFYFFDILTTYRCLKMRKEYCEDIYKNFAIKTVSDTFEYLIKSLKGSELLIYLLSNAYVLNLGCGTMETNIRVVNEDGEITKTASLIIKNLIKKTRKYIMKLGMHIEHNYIINNKQKFIIKESLHDVSSKFLSDSDYD